MVGDADNMRQRLPERGCWLAMLNIVDSFECGSPWAAPRAQRDNAAGERFGLVMDSCGSEEPSQIRMMRAWRM
jgi:hypothetical protein